MLDFKALPGKQKSVNKSFLPQGSVVLSYPRRQ